MKRLLIIAALGLVVAGLGVPTAQARVAGECTNAELVASYRGSGAAMSHRYGWIVLRNESDHACTIQGYGGLSYVGGGDGTQVGAPATRTKGRAPSIEVQPGQRVRSRVVEVSYGVYAPRQCRKAEVDGFRIYLPDETRSQFVAHRTIGCRKHGVHLLSHRAFRRP